MSSLPQTFATEASFLEPDPGETRHPATRDTLATGPVAVLTTRSGPVRLTFDPPAAPDELDAAFHEGVRIGRGNASVPPPDHYSREQVTHWLAGIETGEAMRDRRPGKEVGV